MSILPPTVIQALREAELIQKHDRLCELAAIDAIPIELLQILTLNNQISIVRQFTTTESLLASFATTNNKEVCLAILKNPSITFRIVKILMDHEDNQIRNLAKAHPKNTTAPNSWINPEYLRKISHDKEGMVRCQVAGNTATPADVLALLADDPYDNCTDGRNDTKLVRAAVAGNPSTPIDLLRKLSRDPSCLASIARNSNTPVNILEELAEDNDSYAMYGMTYNPCTPSHILERIVRLHPNGILVLERVARHPNTSAATLSILSAQNTDSRSYMVRMAVASNLNTPSDILVNLSSDPYKFNWRKDSTPLYACFLVRMAVASNPSTPSNILELFYIEKDIFICQALAKNPALSPDLLRSLSENHEYTLQEYSAVDRSIIKTCLSSAMYMVEQSVLLDIKINLSRNCNTPPDVLEKLLSCSHSLPGIASNINTPIAIVEKFSFSKNRGIREAAQARLRSIYRKLAANPETSTEQLWEMLYHRDIEIRLAVLLHPQGLNLLLDRALQLENSLNRFIAGLHPQLSAAQRDRLFYSHNWLDRLAIACNPSTSIEYLQILSQDTHDLIRDIVSQKIID